MTLTEFLQARIAEDELSANQTPDEGLSPDREEFGWNGGIYTWVGREHGYGIGIESGRLLAECAAKRSIIDLHASLDPDTGESVVSTNVLRRLASPYSGHPDYQPEWATE